MAELKPWEIAKQKQTSNLKPWEIAAEKKKDIVTTPVSQSTSTVSATENSLPESNTPVKQDTPPLETNGTVESTLGIKLPKIERNDKPQNLFQRIFGITESQPIAPSKTREEVIAEANKPENNPIKLRAKFDADTKNANKLTTEYHKVADNISMIEKYPFMKDIKEIGDQLNAIGEPKTQEQIDAHNALVGKYNTLRETPLSAFENPDEGSVIGVPDAKGNQTFEDRGAFRKALRGANEELKGHKTVGDLLDANNAQIKKLSEIVPQLKQAHTDLDETKNNYQKAIGYDGKNMGGWESLGHSFSGTLDAIGDHLLPPDMQKKVWKDKMLDEQLAPKEATGVLGKAGEIAGGLLPYVAGGILTGGESWIAQAVTQGLLGGASSGGATGYETFKEELANGKSEDEAMRIANKRERVAGIAGGLAFGLMGAGGLGSGIGAETEKAFAQGITEGMTGKLLAQHTANDAVMKTLKEQGAIAGIFGADKTLNNIYANYTGAHKDLSEGVVESMITPVLIGAAIHGAVGAIKLGAKAPKAAYDVYTTYLAKTKPEVMKAVAEQGLKNGESPQVINQLVADVESKAKVIDGMPADMPFGEVVEKLPLLQQREVLVEKKKKLAEPFVEEHTKLADEIAAIDAKLNPDKELSNLELARQRMLDAKKKLDDNNIKHKIIDDPEERAKLLYEYHSALVGVAKEYIVETADKALHTVEEFAKFIGEKVESVKDVWDEAVGNVEPRNVEDFKGGDGVKKTIATTRAYEGEFRQGVKAELEKLGLTRDIESQVEAKQKAVEFVDSVGEETALEAVRNNDVSDASGAYVWNELIERNQKLLDTETDPAKVAELEATQAKLIDEFGRKALSGGRFASALGDIYKNSDLGYNSAVKASEWEKEFGEKPSEEMMAKWKERDAEFAEIKKKLAEAEQRAKEAEEKQAIADIKETIEREKKSKRYTAKSKEIANEIRKLKSKPIQFVDENGKVIDVTTLGLTWNDLVEGVAKTVEAGGKLADAIDGALKDAEWYAKLTDKGKDAVRKQMEDALRSAIPSESVGKLSVPKSLIHDLVEGGIDNIDELTKAVQQKFPKYTEREVRDAITGYGKIVNPNKGEVETAIRKMTRIGKIVSALEDIADKKRPLRSGAQRDKLDAEERAKHKELREAMKDLPIDEADLEQQLKTALDATKQRTQNQIEDLQREIDKGELTPKSARSIKEDAELKALKEKRDALKKKHDEIFKDEEYKQAKRLELTKKATERRVEDLKRRLNEGDFSKKERKPVIADDELTKLKADKLRLQEEYDKEFYKNKLKNRTQTEVWKDHAWEAWGITRALRATGEWSFVLVQGLVNSIAHPLQAAKAFKNAFKFMFSEKKTEDWLRTIKSQEYYPVMKESKLALTQPNAEISAREELFYSGWTNIFWDALGTPFKLKGKEAYDKWVSANPMKAVERASVGYLDTLRVERFLDGMQMLKEQGLDPVKDKEAYKNVADVINTFTGRASLGAAEQIAPQLSKIFFSPRNWASALKMTLLLPRQIVKWGDTGKPFKPSVAQKMAISDLSKFVGLTTSMVMMSAAYLNNDDDPETGVETDPTSSDFGKIKLGKIRIDPWGGKIQQIVLASRMIVGSTKSTSTGKEKVLGSYGTPTKEELLIEQAVNKLSPSASMIHRNLTSHINKSGEKVDKYGQPYSLKEDVLENLTPIYWGSTVPSLLKDDPSALNGLLAFYAFFGGGVNAYDTKDAPANSGVKKFVPQKLPFNQRAISPTGGVKRWENKK
jgi:hypothetical protein